ncbi:hypothetical protein SISSUDRAFT_1038310 [Sistotremastrum suecicum HHB10207 ss-3]|uniref:Uncharacterized protein n=1 Tax=Sistotremastrum suecicum HHB10207 ss-3 TaxID=1314776 RepID=A0A165WXJ4_9AGAM|nr:hypothetical protein SISSUDRAFT_1038310 [Sistotremastrum suecicum HHB10207 ss-3]
MSIPTRRYNTRLSTRLQDEKASFLQLHNPMSLPTISIPVPPKATLRARKGSDAGLPDVSVVPKKLIDDLFALADGCPRTNYAEFLAAIKTGNGPHSRISTPGHIPRTPNCYIVFRIALWAFRDQLVDHFPPEHKARQGPYFSRIASLFWRQIRSRNGELHGRNVERLCRDVAAWAVAERQRLHPDYKYRPRRSTANKAAVLGD